MQKVYFLRSFKLVLSKIDWLMLVLALLVGCVLGALSILRYTGYNAYMLDLGNMSQAIWSGTQGQPLEFTYEAGNISRLSLHVELFYWLLVPLYALFPSPITLLVFQTLLFVSGAFPVYKLTNRKLQSKTAARLITLTYLFYPVAQTAVLFDFHGDTLAMPLLLFALESLDRQAWKSYYIWLVLALSCKFYVAIPVVIMGIVIWIQGKRHAGLATVLIGLLWGGVTYFMIRPLFSPPGNTGPGFITIWGYFHFYYGNFIQDLPDTIIPRIFTAFVIFLPAVLLATRALLWTLPAVTVALFALASSLSSSFDYRFHHYALTVPFIIAALIFGAEKLRKHQANPNRAKGKLFPWIGLVIATFLFTITLNIFAVDTPMNAKFWNSSPLAGLDATKYGNLPRDRFKDQWLVDHAPSDSPIAASMTLMTHLTNRHELYSLDNLPQVIGEIDYAIADALLDYDLVLNGERHGSVQYDSKAINTLLNSDDFGLVAAQDGLLLFQKDPPLDKVLSQRVEVILSTQPQQVEAAFNQNIGLINSSISTLGERRIRLQYDWVLLQPLHTDMPLIAISRLEGVENARIVHLPTHVLHPTNTWKIGQIIREIFEIELSQDIPPGRYPLWVGWYDSANLYSSYTDVRSRVGEEVLLGSITLP